MTTEAPKALELVVTCGAAVVVAAAVLVLAVVVFTRQRTTKDLAQRVRMVALPTESFDPEAEEVLRLATQLARTRRAVHRWAPRRGDAVRLRLVATEGGRVLQFVEGPRRAESVLRLGGYAEVELLPPETLEKAALLSAVASVVEPGAAADRHDGGLDDEEDLVEAR